MWISGIFFFVLIFQKQHTKKPEYKIRTNNCCGMNNLYIIVYKRKKMASKMFYFISTCLIMKYSILKAKVFSDSLLDD